MRFILRKSTDSTLAALAKRAYLNADASQQKAAETALAAANVPLLTDLAQVPVGALIVVPPVPGLATSAHVRSPDQLAASADATLGRVIAEVADHVYDDYSEDAADASHSVSTNEVVQSNPARADWSTYLKNTVQPAAQARHDASVAARAAVANLYKPLQQDLDALLARLR